MDGDPGAAVNAAILSKISGKSALNQQVFDNTFSVFNALKETLHEMSSELDDRLEEMGHEVKIEYRDRGKFEAQLQVADDILIFSMHSNVFEFNREHIIWQNSYVRDNKANSYCGMINIYNFLSDSFKYNRSADEGYLIGRLFVNREKQYFVEGKRQISMRHNNFGTQQGVTDQHHRNSDGLCGGLRPAGSPVRYGKGRYSRSAQHENRELEDADRQTPRLQIQFRRHLTGRGH